MKQVACPWLLTPWASCDRLVLTDAARRGGDRRGCAERGLHFFRGHVNGRVRFRVGKPTFNKSSRLLTFGKAGFEYLLACRWEEIKK
jgi:hypothetical protein